MKTSAVKELFEYAESREDGILPTPVHLLCDDFAVGAQIPDFAQYISIFRGGKKNLSEKSPSNMGGGDGRIGKRTGQLQHCFMKIRTTPQFFENRKDSWVVFNTNE